MTAEQYLAEHGISEEFALNYGVAFDDNYLNIPVKDEDGKLLFLKSRNLNHGEEGNTDPKYKNPAGSLTTLFNYHAVKDDPNIFLCEGEIDCLKLIEEGIPSVSSTGGAKTFKPEWLDLLKGKQVWICFDNDRAGKDATRALLDLMPHSKVLELPEGVKDICEFFVMGGTKSDFKALPHFTADEWIANHQPVEFDVYTAHDYETLEVTEHPWLIDRVLYSEGFCFIYGAEGTGKSYIALSMADAISKGEPWLGKFKTAKGNVLFLDKENPHSMIKKRLNGLGMTQKNLYWLQRPEKFQFTDMQGNTSEFATSLTNMVIKNKIDLIILDSFVDFIAGSENSSEHTQIFFNQIRELFPRIAYLPLHHENKPSQGVSRSASQRLRGSSNINAQTFTMFRLEAVSKTEMTLLQTKARDSLKLDKFMIRMEVKTLKDGSTTISGFTYMGDIDDSVDAGKLGEVTEAIKNHISSKGKAKWKDLEDTIDGSKATLRRAISDLLSTGELAETREGRFKVYRTGMFNTLSDDETDDILDELSSPIA